MLLIDKARKRDSMEYLISCSCGKDIAIARSQAGQEVECECGNTVKIPTLRGFSDLRVAVAESNAEESVSAASPGVVGEDQRSPSSPYSSWSLCSIRAIVS